MKITLKREENGEIAVMQHEHGGFQLTFNPDDGRFYVHDKDEDHTVISTFKAFRNASFHYKKKAGLLKKKEIN